MSYFDIGANLADVAFADDRQQVVERALARQVHRMAVTGSDIPSSLAAVALAQKQPLIFVATAGVHPHAAGGFDDKARQQLKEIARLREVRAVGETGLDYFRMLSDRAEQLACLRWQLELAVAVGKPVFLHQRDAHGDILPLLREYRPHLPRAVIHCFTGTAEELDDYLSADLDLYIGITGWICDERRGRHLRDLVGRIPANRLLLETDSPYLRPRDLPAQQLAILAKKQRNEPATLPHILHTVAACRKESAEILTSQVWRNSLVFFGLGNGDNGDSP